MSWTYSIWLSFKQSPLFHVLFAVLIGIICGIGAILSPLITVFLFIGIIFLVISDIINKPLLACYILIFATVMTSAMERGRIIPMLVPAEVILILVFGLSLAYVITHFFDKPMSVTILFGTVILILGTSVIPILSYNIRDIPVSFQTIFKWVAPAQYLLLFWIFSTIPRTRVERVRVLQVMFFCASLAAIIALLQAARIPIILDLLLNWYPSGHTEDAVFATGSGLGRTTSVFGAWNVLGTFLMVNFLCLVSLQNEKMPRLYTINMASSAILCLLALLASGSYASIFGTMLGFVFLKLIDPRGLKKLIPVFIAAAFGIILLLPVISERFLFQFESSGSSNSIIPRTLAWRFEQWNDIYIPLVAEDPIWGAVASFEQYSFAHVDSQYLEMLISKGFVSLIAFIIWLGFILIWLLYVFRHESTIMSSLALATITCFLVMILMGITNPVFAYAGVMDYLWIYIALIAGSRKDKLHVAY
ncbi:MAG: O-antigen ligase family protein [Anaerolineae bacterium]